MSTGPCILKLALHMTCLCLDIHTKSLHMQDKYEKENGCLIRMEGSFPVSDITWIFQIFLDIMCKNVQSENRMQDEQADVCAQGKV